MSIIEDTREFGKSIQSDELYIKMQMLERACEEDEEIQALIGELNLKRMAVHNEAQKADRDDEKITALTKEHQEILDKLLETPKMKEFNAVKEEFDSMMKRVNGIISLCADGEDPDTCEYTPSCGAGGCAGCSGCR